MREAASRIGGSSSDSAIRVRICGPGPGVDVLRQRDHDPGAVHAVLARLFRADVVAVEPQLARAPGSGPEGQAGIDQRAKDHVATGAGKRIEEGDFHEGMLLGWLVPGTGLPGIGSCRRIPKAPGARVWPVEGGECAVLRCTQWGRRRFTSAGGDRHVWIGSTSGTHRGRSLGRGRAEQGFGGQSMVAPLQARDRPASRAARSA